VTCPAICVPPDLWEDGSEGQRGENSNPRRYSRRGDVVPSDDDYDTACACLDDGRPDVGGQYTVSCLVPHT